LLRIPRGVNLYLAFRCQLFEFRFQGLKRMLVSVKTGDAGFYVLEKVPFFAALPRQVSKVKFLVSQPRNLSSKLGPLGFQGLHATNLFIVVACQVCASPGEICPRWHACCPAGCV
jgi:hypothetical protein